MGNDANREWCMVVRRAEGIALDDAQPGNHHVVGGCNSAVYSERHPTGE